MGMFLYYLISSFTLVNAYYIDTQSCQGNQRAVMEMGVAEAFLLAQDALHGIQTRGQNQDVGRLANLLFGVNTDLSAAEASFEGILAQKNKKMRADDPMLINDREVVFYCNLDRVQQSSQPGFAGQWVDEVSGRPFDVASGEALKECKSASDVTLGVTWSPGYKSTPNPAYPGSGPPFNKAASPSQVTLCPWFLGWAVNQHFKTLDEVMAKALKVLAAKAAIPLLSKGYPFTPIDAFGLLGKVILHELTHTTTAGVSEDVKIAHGAPIGFDGAAYGWKAALILAREGGVNHESATENADSLALFASGVRLLNQSPPVYIKDDGSLSSKRP